MRDNRVGQEGNDDAQDDVELEEADEAAAQAMIALIKNVRAEGDSVGGVIECVVRGVPPGSRISARSGAVLGSSAIASKVVAQQADYRSLFTSRRNDDSRMHRSTMRTNSSFFTGLVK